MKFFCIGKNYKAHVAEMKGELPTAPVVFMKPNTALLENGRTFYIPDFTSNVHYETEIVLKVKSPGKALSPDRALDHIGGMTLGYDFTARDVQDECKKNRHPWEVAKAFDYSAAIGDFIPFDYDALLKSTFSLKLNGTVVQHGDPNMMIFDIPTIISFLSHRFNLQRGDMIFTGTPSGVGQVHSGDLLQAYLDDKNLLTIDIK